MGCDHFLGTPRTCEMEAGISELDAGLPGAGRVGPHSPSPGGSCQAGRGAGDTRRRGGTHAPSGPAPGATPGRWGSSAPRSQEAPATQTARSPRPRRGAQGRRGDRGPGEAAGRPTPRAPRTGSRVSARGAAPPRSRPLPAPPLPLGRRPPRTQTQAPAARPRVIPAPPAADPPAER